MEHSQVSPNINSNNGKIRSAIDLLLSTNSINVVEPTVQLTECSPDIGVVMKKQGGICTNCNTLFKSKVSLMNHLMTCNPLNSNIDLITNVTQNKQLSTESTPPRIKGPNLVIVSND